MNRKPYHCQSCYGTGTVECDCCGGETECEECRGTRYNLDLIDVAAMRAAEKEMAAKSPPHTGSCELVENGIWVGRKSGVHSIRYEDFPRAKFRQEGEAA